jgi:hypothetical protein
MQKNNVNSSDMGTTAAVQRGLFGEDFEVAPDVSFGSGWRARAQALHKLSEERGGLVPQSALADVLGLSRQRVHQLVQSGQLEVVKVEDVPFITGRSLDAWECDQDKNPKGGWRSRRGGVWAKTIVSFKVGSAMADVLVPDGA